MHARGEQSFVHINVAHSREESLVEQQRFDAGLARFHARLKFVKLDRKRLRAEARQVVIPQNASELALVGENQRTGVERKDPVSNVSKEARPATVPVIPKCTVSVPSSSCMTMNLPRRWID